jgi:hypothetical protein
VAVKTWYPQARVVLQVILDGFGDSDADSDTLVIPVLPKSCTVHINSYKQADSYEIVFDASDFPIDPRLVRAGAAEIYIFQTNGLAAGITSLSRRDPLADPDPSGTRPRTPLETALLDMGTPVSRDKFTLGNKPRIVGLFDQNDMELSESGKWVTITGQDYTAHLASIQFPPTPSGYARQIPTGKRLDLFVTDMVTAADPNGNLTVDVRGLDPTSLPVVGANETRSTARGIPIEQGTTYWDVIYKTVERYGFIAYVDGLDVVISKPKNLSDANANTIKHMAWGTNLTHLSLKRKLGKEQVPTIIARSYDPKTKQTLSVEYPPGQTIDTSVVIDSVGKGKQQRHKVHSRIKETTHVSKTGKVKTTLRERDEFQFVDVYGITDRATLLQVAETRYHLLGKAERTILAKTKDLSDLDQRDILGVAAGDAFMIEWDEFNRALLADPTVTQGEKAAYLIGRGYNSEVAFTVAQYYQQLDISDRPVRFKEGTITFDNDQGIEIEMELQDFIVIDGQRPDDGSVREPRTSRNHAALTDANGKPIGGNIVGASK